MLSQFFKLFSLSLFLFIILPVINLCTEEPTSTRRLALTLNDAILKNLLQQPAIRISLYNITIQRGVAQSSAAPFDPVVNSQIFHTYSKDLLNVSNSITVDGEIIEIADPANPICIATHTDLQGHNTTAHLDVSRTWREGTRMIFSVDVDQNFNPLFCPPKLNQGRMTLEVNQPLLRNFRHGLDYMTELANRQQINSVLFDTLQTISEEVFKTITSYWDTVAKKKILQAQIESEQRLVELVDNVKLLIQREQLAPNDLLQPLAQLSSQITSRILSEQEYYAAQQQLKFNMGEWDEMFPCLNKEFELIDEFPFERIDPYSAPCIFCQLFPAVFKQRFDIQASISREQQFNLLLKGAKNFLLPQLDVIGRATVQDFTQGSRAKPLFSSFEFEHPEKDLTIGIVFSTPFFQDEARGLIKQRQAEWAQAQAQTQFLKQQALAEINTTISDLVNLQGEIKNAKDAVEEYQLLLKNERTKLVAGFSTIFFLLSFESNLTASVITYINLQNEMAKKIALIRFLTGTLIEYAPFITNSFMVASAVTLPFDDSSCKACMNNLKN